MRREPNRIFPKRIACRAARMVMPLAAAWLLCLGIAARADSTLDQARKRGELIIGTDATYQPFENKIGGRFEGFDIELGGEIAKELGVKARFENIAWDAIFAALEAGKFDMVMSGVTITEDRKKRYAFSRPYFLSGQAIARRKGDTGVEKPDSLRGKTVGVQIDTTGQTAVEKLGLPPDHIRKFDSLQDALLEVRNRRAAAAVGDLPALREAIRQGYPELEVVGGILARENVGMVFRKGDAELLAAVNDALGRIVADGRYRRIYQKWMREPLPATYAADLDKVQDRGTAPAENRATGSAFTIRWDVLRSALPILLRGAVTTLYITALTLLIGIPLGLLVALLRLSAFAPLRALATVYVEVIRGTPLLIQIFVIYFVLPAIGISLPALLAAAAALSFNAAAYVSEIFRAGIESIDSGQMEAARSLGMDYGGAMRWVILPQTVRRVLPPLTNEAAALLKDSSLIAIVGVAELTREGRQLVGSGNPTVTVYLAVALLYLAMTLPLTQLVRVLENKWQPISRPRERVVKGSKESATPAGRV